MLLARIALVAVAAGLVISVMALEQSLSSSAQEGASPAAASPHAAETDVLREIVRERLRALVDADLEDADALYAPDFRNINAAGVAQSAEKYLGSVRSGAHVYSVLEPASAIDVRLYGAGAVVTYQSRVDLLSGGNRITGIGWHTEVYERRDGRWQLVWSQTTQVRG